MKKIFLLCGLLPFLSSFAQVENERPARDSFTLQLAINKESFFEYHIPSSPFIVGPKVLQLYPGETVYIEVEEKNGVINDIRSVKENKNPEKTLQISFTQNAEKGVHQNMMLSVKNPFKKDLNYAATIQIAKSSKWHETSIMPVAAGLVGIEMWPDLISSIGLHEWKFVQ